jgi:hypothetical protein
MATIIHGRTIDLFTLGYITAAFWADFDDDADTNPSGSTMYDITPQSLDRIISDCKIFQDRNIDTLVSASSDFEAHGNDFWLSRNGHGAGFFDRGYGTIGDALQDAARPWGKVSIFSQDGQVYFEGGHVPTK